MQLRAVQPECPDFDQHLPAGRFGHREVTDGQGFRRPRPVEDDRTHGQHATYTFRGMYMVAGEPRAELPQGPLRHRRAEPAPRLIIEGHTGRDGRAGNAGGRHGAAESRREGNARPTQSPQRYRELLQRCGWRDRAETALELVIEHPASLGEKTPP